ncbi:LysR family transcriptional regulator [Sodalis sp. dw_96]|uniref:LysR family transcriptional regulator n=1 Tax=Sodalis sp. dw_96 TaxID=2719794 RepID=UPI001BD57510|nr:LysR family transcriptional regulator [Sodalis sp. dw_96]
MLNMNQLRCFVTVATELNFRRAAHTLNMSQPPLTRQIQLLEYQLNVKLIDRSTRSVSLTAAGKIFYREASKLLEHIHQVEQITKRIANGEEGSVSLGFVANAFYQYLPRTLAMLRDEHPYIKISLLQLSTYDLLESVYSQQTDLGISRIVPTRSIIESHVCIHEPFIAALPKDHPLTSHSKIRLEDLENQSVIMYSVSWKPFYDLLTQAFDRADVKPNYVLYESSTVNILSLVNVNFGVALVPQSASTFKLDNVVYRELDCGYPLDNILYFIWRRDNNNEAFHMILQKILAQDASWR